jgi:hypothetical protein
MVIEDPLCEGFVEKLATGVCEKALIDVIIDSKNNNLSLNSLVFRLHFIRLNFVNPYKGISNW